MATPISGVPRENIRDARYLSQFMQHHREKIAANPAIRYLMTPDASGGNPSLPLYTPTLDPALPEITYYVHMSAEAILDSGKWFYFKVMNAGERHTLWVLQALKRYRLQIPSTSLSRATAFTAPCVITHVTPVAPSMINRIASRAIRSPTARPRRWRRPTSPTAPST